MKLRVAKKVFSSARSYRMSTERAALLRLWPRLDKTPFAMWRMLPRWQGVIRVSGLPDLGRALLVDSLKRRLQTEPGESPVCPNYGFAMSGRRSGRTSELLARVRSEVKRATGHWPKDVIIDGHKVTVVM